MRRVALAHQQRNNRGIDINGQSAPSNPGTLQHQVHLAPGNLLGNLERQRMKLNDSVQPIKELRPEETHQLPESPVLIHVGRARVPISGETQRSAWGSRADIGC